MRKLFLSAAIMSLIGGHALEAADLNREAILKAVERIAEKQESLAGELTKLKQMLGLDGALDDISLLKPSDKMSERVTVRIEDGLKAYEKKQFQKAKETFQQAWEAAPDSHVTNFNLGMAYYQLGNVPLAKKMLKTTLEKEPKVASHEKIKAYLSGTTEDKEDSSALTSAEKKLDREVTNLKNEASSYRESKGLTIPKRRGETVRVLREIVERVQGHPKLQKKHLRDVADTYALFELYPEALKTFGDYEASMEDEVLPDGYHAKRLEVEAKQEEQEDVLDSYTGNRPPHEVRRRLSRDIQELEIFAAQFDEFVKELSDDDEDFDKISQRLGEFRWGGQANRHALVVNRFEELLYSSLEGTVAIDRYQDAKGNKFLKNITRLADKMSLKQVEFVPVELEVNKQKIPYLILFTYIPKHEAFLIVRLPKKDLV